MEPEVGRIADGDRAGGPSDLSRSTASQPKALIPCAVCWAVEGQWPYFQVIRSARPSYDYLHTPNAAAVNGAYATKVEALTHLVASLEETRRDLSEQVARHKRALRQAIAMETRRADTPKSESVAKR